MIRSLSRAVAPVVSIKWPVLLCGAAAAFAGSGILEAAYAAPPRNAVAASAATAAPSPVQAPAANASSPLPSDPIARIRDEGLNHSHYMELIDTLSNVIGPRLTGSPAMKRANEWTRDQLASWGLENAHLEPWGPFGRGWVLDRFSAQVLEPQCIPLIAYPKAWSPGTNGPIVADLIYLDAADEGSLARYKGKLKGTIVLISQTRDVTTSFEPAAERLSESSLAKLAAAPPPAARGGQPGRFRGSPEMRARLALNMRKLQLATDEGAAAVLEASAHDGGIITVQQATVPQPADAPFGRRVAAWDLNAPRMVPQIVVSVEQYNRMVRMLAAGEHLRLGLDLAAHYVTDDPMAYDTIAEIPGTDLKDQIVMVGGHLDSWHAATGATDNGAGAVAAMEAVRILEALHLHPRRTIRIGLWSGEEEGLLGSRAYVAKHFGSRAAPSSNGRQTTGSPAPQGGPAAQAGPGVTPVASTQDVSIIRQPEYDDLDVYFNLDNGTGKIRGVYLQGNEAAGPIFTSLLAPFSDLGASTITISNTGGTDHQSFDAIGLPGFQFIQDNIDYETRTHHTNQDLYERIQPEDMKQASTILAAFLYDAAMRDQMIPRKPLAGAPANVPTGPQTPQLPAAP